jgi:epoxyqueuosine reductase
MKSNDISANLLNAIEQEGCRAKMVSVDHLEDLKKDINTLHQQGYFDEEFFSEELSGFDFRLPGSLPGTKSLIIAAAPQPQVRVTFTLADKELACIIPPTYSYATDRKIEELLRLQLEPAAYHFKKVRIPWKLLAVRSGLAQYGKNNITYMPGPGSFYRLVAFVTDLPYAEDSWGELHMLKDCTHCDACAKACPGGAIGAGRFLLHAERCITFHNERQGNFPAWIKPSWHHCLVGCMICQKVCPVDKHFRKWVVEGPGFTAEETACLRQGANRDEPGTETLKKLDQLDMTEYVDVLGRNLEALIGKHSF